MKELVEIIERLDCNDFPELTFVGYAYNKKMLLEDLNRVLSLIGKASECDSERY